MDWSNHSYDKTLRGWEELIGILVYHSPIQLTFNMHSIVGTVVTISITVSVCLSVCRVSTMSDVYE